MNEILSSSGLPGFATTRILRALVDRGIAEPLPSNVGAPAGSTTMDLTELLEQRRARLGAQGRSTSPMPAPIQVAGSGPSEARPRAVTPSPMVEAPAAEAAVAAPAPVPPEEVASPPPSEAPIAETPSSPGPRSVSGEMEVVSAARARRASPYVSFVYPENQPPVEDAPPPEPPSGLEKRIHVGPYRVVGRLAKGGVGSVYLCSRSGAFGFRRLFALKVIRQHLDKTVDAEHAFATEARIGGKLSHPQLNGVLDAGLYEQQPYLIMPYVEGLNLQELLGTGRPAPAAAIVSVMCDVLSGLQYLHDLIDDDGRPLRLVHGDLSPDNILVGVDGSARLTDFGRVRPAGAVQSLDARGMVGKPGFMAPEQMQGQRIDGRTDLFSLGIVLWTALTGKTLFAEETFEATVMNTLRRPIDRPSSFGAPACLDDVCLRALSRNPETRFRSADEMRVALQTAAAGNGLFATSGQVSTWVRDSGSEQFAERRRLILLDAADIDTEGAAPLVQAQPKDTAELPLGPPGGPTRTMILPRQFTPRMGVPQINDGADPELRRSKAEGRPAFALGWFVAGLLGAALGSVAVAIVLSRTPHTETSAPAAAAPVAAVPAAPSAASPSPAAPAPSAPVAAAPAAPVANVAPVAAPTPAAAPAAAPMNATSPSRRAAAPDPAPAAATLPDALSNAP
ncbi:MAG: protein kinase [Deltaproteobacteria bacterium]|nr:protein kinase [Deltaproteobacteria bacterium]